MLKNIGHKMSNELNGEKSYLKDSVLKGSLHILCFYVNDTFMYF